MKYCDTVVIGGGIIGLSCAYSEAMRGKKVTILEKHNQSTKASWAAAGILGTQDAQIFHSAFREFSVNSIRLYPEWLKGVCNTAQNSLNIQWGSYKIFDAEHCGDEWQKILDRLQREGAKNYEIHKKTPHFLEHLLEHKQYHTIFFPEDGYIDTRELLQVLQTACLQKNVEYIGDTKIQQIQSDNQQVEITSSTGKFTCSHCLIAAGAWSNEVLHLIHWQVPLIPVKGQMIKIPHLYSERQMVYCNEELYFVPRADGIIVGATTEPRVWNEDFDDIGENFISQHLTKVLGRCDFQRLEQWCGIRSRTKDRLPLIGFVNPEKTVSLCVGHYKNGIGMAPLSAICMSQLINHESPMMDLSPFDPHRKKGLLRL